VTSGNQLSRYAGRVFVRDRDKEETAEVGNKMKKAATETLRRGVKNILIFSL